MRICWGKKREQQRVRRQQRGKTQNTVQAKMQTHHKSSSGVRQEGDQAGRNSANKPTTTVAERVPYKGPRG